MNIIKQLMFAHFCSHRVLTFPQPHCVSSDDIIMEDNLY